MVSLGTRNNYRLSFLRDGSIIPIVCIRYSQPEEKGNHSFNDTLIPKSLEGQILKYKDKKTTHDGPASKTSTLTVLFSVRRLAITLPATPPAGVKR